jgi:tRNA dimethylallyltransferase
MAETGRPRRVPVLCGPTGVGKTEVAVTLAEQQGLELVSADSRQVYTWLDIGTAKPAPDLCERVGIHMVNMVEPNRVYSAADYARDALAVMRRLSAEGRRFLVVGGAGMYLRALFQPFFDAPKSSPELRKRFEALPVTELYARLCQVDPDRAVRLHPNDRQRIERALELLELTGKTMTELLKQAAHEAEFEPDYIVLDMEREALYRRIEQRFDGMMSNGLLEEVRGLKEAGFGRDTYVANAYGYAELLAHLDGELSLEDAVKQAKAKSRAYARRQLIWFRAIPGARRVECRSEADAVRQVGPMLEELA